MPVRNEMAITLTELIPYANIKDLPNIARAAFNKGNFIEAVWIFAALNKTFGAPIFAVDVELCKFKINRALQLKGKSCLFMQMGGLASGDPDIAAIATSFTLPPARNKIAIYTAQFGSYDPLHEPERKEDNIDYYYFTDNPNLHSDIFQIIPIMGQTWPSSLLARCFKTLPHIFLHQYEQTIWIDSSTYLRGQPIENILTLALANHDIAIHAHSKRDCIYNECEECRLLKKDLKHNIDNMERLLRTLRYPECNGLMETAQIFRSNCFSIAICNEIWWYFIKNITIRDQLSLPFIMHSLDINSYILPYSPWSNKFARIYSHSINMPKGTSFPVDIIIPVHNHIDITERCITSLLKKTNYADYHLYIIDNASDTDTKCGLASLSSQYPNKMTIVTNMNNESFSKANNQILNITTRPYILFLNNDIEIIDENWLTSMMSTMTANKSIGAIGPILINEDYTIQSAGIYLKIFENRPVMPGRHHKNFVHDKFVHAISAACLLSRRTILSSLHGFDERFIYGQEDVDLCMRIRQKGYKIAVDTQTEVIHHESTTRKYSPQTQTNRDLFISKWENLIMELHLPQMQENN